MICCGLHSECCFRSVAGWSSHYHGSKRAPAAGAGRLHPGDPVQISAYAYPARVLRGRVEEIADYVGKREIKPNNPAVSLGLMGMANMPHLIMKLTLPVSLTSILSRGERRRTNACASFTLKIIQVKIVLQEATPLKLGMTVDVRIGPKGK